MSPTVSRSNICTLLVVLDSLLANIVVSNLLWQGNVMSSADKEVLFHYLPNFQNIFNNLLFPWKFSVIVAKPYCQAHLYLSTDQRKGEISPLVACVELVFIIVYLFWCTYNYVLILFQLMLTFSSSCIILNWSSFFSKW